MRGKGRLTASSARWAIRLAVVATAAIVFVAIQGEATHAGSASAKISTQVLVDTANGQTTPFVILLRDQADLSKAYDMTDQDARGWFVYNTLKETAAETQGPILDALDTRGVPHRLFWIANMITTEGDRSLVEDLADRADVKAIESNDGADWLT